MHLGHPVGTCYCIGTAITTAVKDIVWKTNGFGSYSYDLRMLMFLTYCISYYGSPLWDIHSFRVDILYVDIVLLRYGIFHLEHFCLLNILILITLV